MSLSTDTILPRKRGRPPKVKEAALPVIPETPAPGGIPDAVFDASYIFRLRRHRGGSFNGLWELTRLNRYGEVEEIIADADALNFAVDNMIGKLEGDGF